MSKVLYFMGKRKMLRNRKSGKCCTKPVLEPVRKSNVRYYSAGQMKLVLIEPTDDDVQDICDNLKINL